jgi:hypothetical protein
MLFDVTKQLEHGTTNSIIARLAVEAASLLASLRALKSGADF